MAGGKRELFVKLQLEGYANASQEIKLFGETLDRTLDASQQKLRESKAEYERLLKEMLTIPPSSNNSLSKAAQEDVDKALQVFQESQAKFDALQNQILSSKATKATLAASVRSEVEQAEQSIQSLKASLEALQNAPQQSKPPLDLAQFKDDLQQASEGVQAFSQDYEATLNKIFNAAPNKGKFSNLQEQLSTEFEALQNLTAKIETEGKQAIDKGLDPTQAVQGNLAKFDQLAAKIGNRIKEGLAKADIPQALQAELSKASKFYNASTRDTSSLSESLGLASDLPQQITAIKKQLKEAEAQLKPLKKQLLKAEKDENSIDKQLAKDVAKAEKELDKLKATYQTKLDELANIKPSIAPNIGQDLKDSINKSFKDIQEAAKKEAQVVSQAFRTLGVRSDDSIEAEKDQLFGAFNAIKNSGVASAREVDQAYKTLQDGLKKLDKELGVVDDQLQKTGNIGKKAASIITQAFEATGKTLKNVFVELPLSIGKSIIYAFSIATAFQAVQGILDGIRNTLVSIYQAASEAQTAVARLTVANTQNTTSQAEAARQATKEYKELQQFARKAGIETKDLTEAYITLKNRGIAPTKELLTQLNDVNESLGKQGSGGSIYQLAQALTDLSTGTSRSLQEQFNVDIQKIEGLPGKVIASNKGISQIFDESTQGAKELLGWMSQLPGVAGITEEKFKTLEGSMNNLKNLGQELVQKIGNDLAPAFQEITIFAQNFVTELTTSVDKSSQLSTYGKEIAEWFKQHNELAKTLATALKELLEKIFTKIAQKAEELADYLEKNPKAIDEAIAKAKDFVGVVTSLVGLTADVAANIVKWSIEGQTKEADAIRKEANKPNNKDKDKLLAYADQVQNLSSDEFKKYKEKLGQWYNLNGLQSMLQSPVDRIGRSLQGLPNNVSDTANGGKGNNTFWKAPITGHLGDPRPGYGHQGVDYAIPQGTKLYAELAGIAQVMSGGRGGDGVLVKDPKGNSVKFFHLSSIGVKDGQQVSRGDYLGLSGGDPGTKGAGASTGAHLHREVRVNGVLKNPLDYGNDLGAYLGQSKATPSTSSSSAYTKMTDTGTTNAKGQKIFKVDVIANGKVVETALAYSGRPGDSQVLTEGSNSSVGKGAYPIPQGEYNIGKLEQGNFGKVGDTWMGLSNASTNERDGFGFHLDTDGVLGTEGCIIFQDKATIQRIAASIERNSANKLSVQYGIGGSRASGKAPITESFSPFYDTTFYGTKGDGTIGRPTANGDIFDPNKLTVALSKSLADSLGKKFGDTVVVYNPATKQSVSARYNDTTDNLTQIDLSAAAFAKIAPASQGRIKTQIIPNDGNTAQDALSSLQSQQEQFAQRDKDNQKVEALRNQYDKSTADSLKNKNTLALEKLKKDFALQPDYLKPVSDFLVKSLEDTNAFNETILPLQQALSNAKAKLAQKQSDIKEGRNPQDIDPRDYNLDIKDISSQIATEKSKFASQQYTKIATSITAIRDEFKALDESKYIENTALSLQKFQQSLLPDTTQSEITRQTQAIKDNFKSITDEIDSKTLELKKKTQANDQLFTGIGSEIAKLKALGVSTTDLEKVLSQLIDKNAVYTKLLNTLSTTKDRLNKQQLNEITLLKETITLTKQLEKLQVESSILSAKQELDSLTIQELTRRGFEEEAKNITKANQEAQIRNDLEQKRLEILLRIKQLEKDLSKATAPEDKSELEDSIAKQKTLLDYYEKIASVNLENIRNENKLLGVSIDDMVQTGQDSFRSFLDDFVDAITTGNKSIGDTFLSLFASITKGLAKMFLDVGNKSLFNIIKQAIFGNSSGFGTTGGGAGGLASLFGGLFGGGGGGFFSSAISSAGATDFGIGSILGALPSFGFASGGLVTGEGTGTSDSILARLSNGEFIMNAASTRFLGEDNLNYLNRGVIPPSFSSPQSSTTPNRNTIINVNIDSKDSDSFRASTSQIQQSLAQALYQSDSRR